LILSQPMTWLLDRPFRERVEKWKKFFPLSPLADTVFSFSNKVRTSSFLGDHHFFPNFEFVKTALQIER
jgi:hypothetical protein